MSSNPAEIRSQIETTRAYLSDDVDTLAYQASPSHIAERQVQKVKASGSRLLDRVLGSAEDMKDAAGEKVGAVGDAVSDVPDSARRRTQGNPLAAGMVAFGVGLLVSAAFPPSEKERELASDIKEKAQPLTDKVTEAAKDMASNLSEPAGQAVDSLKQSATESVQNVKEEAQDATSDVRDVARDNVSDVKDTAQQARSGSGSGMGTSSGAGSGTGMGTGSSGTGMGTGSGTGMGTGTAMPPD
ncbi:MAG: DUF3618 domain-containing protein [Actinobacteria bacterium]|nr:DUF3618 domain-containing protein [Actinomycetota bacterium]